MAGKLKDLYVKRNQNQYQPAADSWEARAAELSNMSGGAMPQGETAGNGVFGWLKDSADAGFFSTLGGTARLAGEFMPFGNDTFNSWADKADEIARRNSPQPGQNLEGADYVASAVGNALGSGGASALEAGVVAGIGSLLGVGGVAGAALGGASKVIPSVGKAVQAGKTLWGSPMGKYLVANVAGSPFEAASESGNLISDMRKENQQGTANYSDEEIRNAAIRSGALNLAWLTGMNMLEAGTLGKITGALGGNMAAKGVKDIAKRATLGGLSSGIGEGAEEYGQNLIGDYSKRGNTADFNYDEAMEAAKMGAIGGGVLGGLGSGLSATFSKKNSDVAEEIASEDGGTIEEAPEATVSGKEAFINAIAGQESGGNYNAENGDTGAYGKYQIMPSNWPAWAEEAGIGADAPRTPENQEIVARFKLGQYYDKYGARGAAIAWYGGEGALNYSEEALNRKQGDNGEYPSINEYADEVLGRMGNVADSVRIDDTEENYFDESNYTDDAILGALRPARGFDVSHLENGEAQDRNSVAQFEKLSPEVEAQRKEFTRQQEIENRRKQSNALMEELRAAGNNPQRTARYGFEQRKVSPADALAHGFGKIETIPNIDTQKAFNNNIQTNIMRKRSKTANGLRPNLQFDEEQTIPGSLYNFANSPRDMANITNFKLQNDNAATDKSGMQWELPQQQTQNAAQEEAKRQAAIRAIAEYQKLINEQEIGAVRPGQATFRPNVSYNYDYRSAFVPNARRALALQNNIRQQEQPSIEPTPRNGRALDERNFREITLPKVREQHKWDKEHKEYHAERYGESALPQTQLLSTDRAARRNMPKPGIEARSFINDRAEKKSARERMQDAIAFVWGDDPKHPLKACRRQLNMFRDMRKEYLQPIYDVMAEGAGNGVSRIPIIEFDNQHRGRFYRQSNNSPWYAKYFKEHKKKPTQKAMYDIAEEVAFGENADVGYYAGVQGKELEAIVAENHEQLDPINDYIQTYESLELRLKENPNYGKEQAERINKAEEERRAAKRNVGETASAESIKTEAKQPTESNQDEVKETAKPQEKPEPRDLLFTVKSNGKEEDNVIVVGIMKSKEPQYQQTIKKMLDAGWKKAETNTIPNVALDEYYAPATEENYNFAKGLTNKAVGYNLMGGQPGGWDYMQGLLDHEAEARRKADRTLGEILEDEGITADITVDDNQSITIEFSKKPSDEVRQSVKEAGYKWRDGVWKSKVNERSMGIAKELGYRTAEKGETEQGEKLNLPKGTTVDVSIVGDNSNIIQVKFNGAQGKGTGGILGRAGYVWKKDKQLWQARKTEKAMDIAEQLGYTEEAKPQERDYELERDELWDTFATKLGIDNILSVDKANEELKGVEGLHDGAIVYSDNNNRLYHIISKESDPEMLKLGYNYDVSTFDVHHMPISVGAVKTADEVIKRVTGRSEQKAEPKAKPSADTFSKNPDALVKGDKISSMPLSAMKFIKDMFDKGEARQNAKDAIRIALFKSKDLEASARNNTYDNFKIAYFDAAENYLADNVDNNPAYAKLLESGSFAKENMERAAKETYNLFRVGMEKQAESKPAEKQETKEPATRFDGERARKSLDALIGRKKKSEPQKNDVVPKSKFMNVFNEDELDAEIEKAKKEMSKLSANPMFNPALMKSLFKIGGIYLQKGVNKFAAWADNMVDVMGEKVRPFLPAVWDSLKKYPDNQKFNDDVMTAVMEYVGEGVDNGKSLSAIKREFADDYGDEYLGYVDAAFEGVKKYPTSDNVADVVESKQDNTEGGKENGNNEARSGSVSENQQSEPVQGAESSGETGRVSGQSDEQYERQVQQPENEPAEKRPSTRGSNGAGSVSAYSGQGENSTGAAGRGTVPLTPAQKADAKPSETPGHNYTVTKDSLGDGGVKTKYKNNVEAIKLLKQLEAEGRQATPAEQEVLANYVGWGGLSPVFNINYKGEAMDSSWAKEAKELKELLTDEEYKAARASTTTAFYTPVSVIKNIYGALERLGFKGGKILEPSMGTGNFFGVMPESMRGKSSLNGVELDPLTGRIAKQLYQKANVEITGFEKAKFPDNYFDLAISNVPFGSFRLDDAKYNKYNLNIHNYFFAKAMDKVRPGGLVCFVTSTDTMQGRGDSAKLRALLKGKADLVGAVRLPDTTFKANANTEVTSDVIILQKRKDGAAPSKFTQDWLKTVPSGVKDNYNNDLAINEYFKKHPEMVLGELKSGGRYGSLVVDGKGVNIDKAMQKAIKKLPADIYEARTSNRNTNSIESAQKFLAPNNSREGAFIEKDGKVYRVQQAEMTELPKTAQKKAKEYVSLRDVAKRLLSEQINPDTTDEQLTKTRAELNKVYDKFVEQYGPINDKKNIRALSLDPDYGILEAIEDYKVDPLTNKATVSKRAIFTQRTVNPVREVTHADNVNDALALSMSQTGGVDLGYMSKLMDGKDEDSILKELGERVYENPATDGIELAEAYLSGNVREKLEIAETAAKTDERFKKNVEALKKVQPKDLEPEDISVSLGAPWIPASDIQRFAAHLLGNNFYIMDVNYIPAAGTWKVDWGKAKSLKTSVDATQTWGTKYKNVKDLLEAALNQSTPTVTHKDADGKTYTDKEETIAAQAKLREIQEEFKKWIWTDKERTNRLLAYYNRNFNNWVLRSYDGSALTFPGYSTAEPQLKQHQKDVVWRILQDGTCLMAHCVGAGKTWSMQTAAMELKRLGLANKSMFVIPNHMLQQFENEFRRIYPNAKLLTISSDTLPDVNVVGASKMSKAKLAERKAEKNAKRQSVLGKIATEDWDGIIISHNIFKRIPMSPEAYNRFYEQQIAEVEQAILDINATEGKSGNAIVKKLETTKKNLEAKLKENTNEEAKDVVIPFEQLGIDQIFVDEADQFKNLYFATKMQRIAGMSRSESQRAMDMFMKTQYLINANNGRGVVFATGTPISNTMAEMFTMLRYLDNQGLKEKNLGFFDNWAATFATKETTAELSPDGSGYRTVEKFTKFNNMPELTKMFRKVADVKKIEDLDLKIPKLKNGKPTVVEIPMNSALETYIKETAKERAAKIHNRAVDPQEDNMLKLTGDLRKASLDMRLVDPAVPASVAGGKIKAVVEHIADKYKETDDVNGVQLVFCDLSTPKGEKDKVNESDDVEEKEEAEDNSNITVYAEIKKGLIKKGIPAEQIAFIHDAKTKAQKEQLFERCRQGQVRVLIGSTEKMGAGTNIQNKLVAEHHVDAPWRPRDIEQREGRILRQGNENEEVEIFNYVTKGSFDANMWEKLKNKATMIGQAMSGNLVQRSLEDADATVLSFAEVEALASGNPLMAERVMVNAKLTQMEALAENYRRDQEKNRRVLAAIPNNIKVAEANAEKAKADIANRKDISGENFSMVIGRNKTVYTKRTDAKTELERIASHYTNELGGVVAKAGGFDIRFRAIPAGKLFMSNDGKTAYTASENTVRAEIVGEDTYFCEPTLGSIEHAIMHAPDKALETANRIIVSGKEEMKQLEAKINEPFKYADEYESLRKRSAEIEEALNKSSEQSSDTQYSVSSEAVQRAKEEVEAEIKKALPGAELEQREDGSYIATMPNGKRLGIVIEEQILLNERQAEKAGEAHNRAASEAEGYWSRWEQLDGKNIDGVIRVSRNSRVGTAFHETLHAAMDLCLTDKEKAALYKAFAKKAKESGRSVDEEIADAYKEWVIKRQSGQGSMFGKLFQKAKDFLNKLYTMFVEADNKGNIFRKLESGEAWKQQTYNASEAPKFNITSADIKKFINAALKNPAKHLRMVLGKVSNAEAKAIKKATGMDVQNFTHVWFSEDVRHIKNRHGVGNEKDKRQIGLTQKDIEKAIDVIKSPDRIEKGTTDKGRESIRFMKANSNGEYTVVEVVSNDKKQLAIKTMWNKKEAATTKRHADEISPQYTSETGSGNTASVSDTVSSNSQEVKYSVAPAKHKIANAFTNTERKGTIETAKDFIKEQKKNWYTDLIDKNHILKSFDQLTKTGLSVYDQVQNLPSTTAGMLKAICEGNALSIKAANQHLKNVKMKYNITLAMALAQIDKKTMDKAQPKYLAANGFDSWVNAFGAYLGAERLLEMNDLAKADGKVYKFPKGLTEAELRAFTRNAPEQFRKAADMFYKVNDNMISVMEDAQVFSHDLAQQLRTKYKKYCPLLRDFSDTAAADTFINGLTEGGRGIGNVSVPLKKINIEGSERGVLNPLESVLKSYSVMLNRAERNKVGLMAVNAAKTAQLHDLIKEVPEVKGKDGKVVNAVADPKNCIFTVLVNGKKKAYQTTQELYSPIVGYNLPAAGLCINVARMAAHMLRTGATMSPSFIVRNFLRDTIFASISSKNGFVPFVDSIRGALALWNDPAMRAEFEAAGVTEFNFYGSQNARIKSIDAMAGENPVGMWQMAKWLFTHMEAASDFVESSTRMGEFMKAKEKGLSMEEAARAAREVTLDFSRSGVVGEQINRYVPFFNACLQGGDKMVRLFREDFVGTSLKVFKYIVLPSLLIMAMNWDEDWYKDLDPDIKNNYWCLGRNIRIPKPQEAGVLFGSGIEALVQQAADKDKEAVENWLKAFSSNIIPGIVPTLFLPILEWQANYSYFKGRQLVGSKYQRLPDELQYNDYTSELSKGIGSVLKVSPMKVDNLVRGYTGTMGSLLWNAAGEPFAKANNLPAKHFNEILFVRDFNVTDANLSRPMNEFYGILDKANRQHAGYGVKGKPAAAVKGIRSAGTMISNIRKDIDKITHSKLSPERKRELIDKRKEKMNQIAKQATARYGKYFE
jgi:N12 class adenine-specific DNA methylase